MTMPFAELLRLAGKFPPKPKPKRETRNRLAYFKAYHKRKRRKEQSI